MRVAIYARYSSDNQRDASIADQIRICRTFAQRERWTIADEFHDHAISGATLLRPGFQADTAGLFKRLTFLGVRIVTLAEGEITHLHVTRPSRASGKFLRPDLFEEFCQEFTRETKRLRMAARASLTATERELGRV
jgi:site-specific DNA recombinase